MLNQNESLKALRHLRRKRKAVVHMGGRQMGGGQVQEQLHNLDSSMLTWTLPKMLQILHLQVICLLCNMHKWARLK